MSKLSIESYISISSQQHAISMIQNSRACPGLPVIFTTTGELSFYIIRYESIVSVIRHLGLSLRWLEISFHVSLVLLENRTVAKMNEHTQHDRTLIRGSISPQRKRNSKRIGANVTKPARRRETRC